MNLKTQVKLIAIAVASVFGGLAQAADKAPQGSLFVGDITPKLYFFDDFNGPGADRTQYVETYGSQQAMGGGSLRSGGYLDFDLDLVGNDGRRDFLLLERRGFGAHNHRGSLAANSDTLGFAGYYSRFRSASHGFNFLHSPGGGVPGGFDPLYAGNTNTGYLAQFNNDTTQTRFRTDRTTYGMSLALKPTLFAAPMAAEVDYDGYSRDGNRFATWVLGNGDVNAPGATAGRVLERWRGFDKPIDEKMNRLMFRLSGAPGGVQLSYDGAIEKFDNRARTSVVNDFATSIQTLPAGTASGAVIDPGVLMRSVHFVPDSTLITNNFRFATSFGGTAIAAGYGMSRLEQDTFSPEQQAAGYDTGKIKTSSAYLTVNSNVTRSVGLEGFVRYNDRKNDSTRLAPGIVDPTDGEALNVRVDRYKTLGYGLAATFRPGLWRSSVAVGWKHEDKDRDLSWSDATVAATSIQPHESLYSEKTKSDELYMRWIARPMPGMVLRVTPAYVSSRDTGLPSEPEKGVTLKTKLSYTAATGMLVSGHYSYKGVKNNDRAFTNSNAAGLPTGVTTRQDNDRKQQAAGAMLNMPFGEAVRATASLSWVQDDFKSYFLRADRRRYEGTQTVNFANFDRSNYDIDTYVFTLGGDWQVSKPLRLNAGYIWSRSKGNTASGVIGTELSAGGRIDGAINNTIHTLALGLDYAISKSVTFRGSYAYDNYRDKVYSGLSGGYHMLMLGASFGF